MLSCMGRPGNSSAASVVVQTMSLEYGERRCVFITKHQSTKAPVRLLVRSLPPSSERGSVLRSERKHGFSADQAPVSAYVGSSKNLKDLKDPGVYASANLIWFESNTQIEDHPLATRRKPSALEAGSVRSFTVIRKEAGLFCGSFLRKGKVFA